MINFLKLNKHFLKPWITSFILVSFIFTSIMPPSNLYAQAIPASVLGLPVPGTMIGLSKGFTPAIVRGITVDPKNPLEFNFYIDKGDSSLSSQDLNAEAKKLVKYFLATLTTPEKDLWVNLSPYEKDRIIPKGFGDTEMGRDLLSQDYILKQITSSLMYPENKLGAEFWDKVYKEAREKYGVTDIPVDTFNKVWVVPEKAVVYEHGTSAFVIEAKLKVMLDEDYFAEEENSGRGGSRTARTSRDDNPAISGISSNIIRQIIIPALEKEVNEGKNFALLRQVYNSLVLATWYKMNLKETLLSKVYVDKNKNKGIDVNDKNINQKIYDQYIASFKKGVYSYIKEDYDPLTQQIIPRKYFSGGNNYAMISKILKTTKDFQGNPSSLFDSAMLDYKFKLNDFSEKGLTDSAMSAAPETYEIKIAGEEIMRVRKEAPSKTTITLKEAEGIVLALNGSFRKNRVSLLNKDFEFPFYLTIDPKNDQIVIQDITNDDVKSVMVSSFYSIQVLFTEVKSFVDEITYNDNIGPARKAGIRERFIEIKGYFKKVFNNITVNEEVSRISSKQDKVIALIKRTFAHSINRELSLLDFYLFEAMDEIDRNTDSFKESISISSQAVETIIKLFQALLVRDQLIINDSMGWYCVDVPSIAKSKELLDLHRKNGGEPVDPVLVIGGKISALRKMRSKKEIIIPFYEAENLGLGVGNSVNRFMINEINNREQYPFFLSVDKDTNDIKVENLRIDEIRKEVDLYVDWFFKKREVFKGDSLLGFLRASTVALEKAVTKDEVVRIIKDLNKVHTAVIRKFRNDINKEKIIIGSRKDKEKLLVEGTFMHNVNNILSSFFSAADLMGIYDVGSAKFIKKVPVMKKFFFRLFLFLETLRKIQAVIIDKDSGVLDIEQLKKVHRYSEYLSYGNNVIKVLNTEGFYSEGGDLAKDIILDSNSIFFTTDGRYFDQRKALEYFESHKGTIIYVNKDIGIEDGGLIIIDIDNKDSAMIGEEHKNVGKKVSALLTGAREPVTITLKEAGEMGFPSEKKARAKMIRQINVDQEFEFYLRENEDQSITIEPFSLERVRKIIRAYDKSVLKLIWDLGKITARYQLINTFSSDEKKVEVAKELFDAVTQMKEAMGQLVSKKEYMFRAFNITSSEDKEKLLVENTIRHFLNNKFEPINMALELIRRRIQKYNPDQGFKVGDVIDLIITSYRDFKDTLKRLMNLNQLVSDYFSGFRMLKITENGDLDKIYRISEEIQAKEKSFLDGKEFRAYNAAEAKDILKPGVPCYRLSDGEYFYREVALRQLREHLGSELYVVEYQGEEVMVFDLKTEDETEAPIMTDLYFHDERNLIPNIAKMDQAMVTQKLGKRVLNRILKEASRYKEKVVVFNNELITADPLKALGQISALLTNDVRVILFDVNDIVTGEGSFINALEEKLYFMGRPKDGGDLNDVGELKKMKNLTYCALNGARVLTWDEEGEKGSDLISGKPFEEEYRIEVMKAFAIAFIEETARLAAPGNAKIYASRIYDDGEVSKIKEDVVRYLQVLKLSPNINLKILDDNVISLNESERKLSIKLNAPIHGENFIEGVLNKTLMERISENVQEKLEGIPSGFMVPGDSSVEYFAVNRSDVYDALIKHLKLEDSFVLKMTGSENDYDLLKRKAANKEVPVFIGKRGKKDKPLPEGVVLGEKGLPDIKDIVATLIESSNINTGTEDKAMLTLQNLHHNANKSRRQTIDKYKEELEFTFEARKPNAIPSNIDRFLRGNRLNAEQMRLQEKIISIAKFQYDSLGDPIVRQQIVSLIDTIKSQTRSAELFNRQSEFIYSTNTQLLKELLVYADPLTNFQVLLELGEMVFELKQDVRFNGYTKEGKLNFTGKRVNDYLFYLVDGYKVPEDINRYFEFSNMSDAEQYSKKTKNYFLPEIFNILIGALLSTKSLKSDREEVVALLEKTKGIFPFKVIEQIFASHDVINPSALKELIKIPLSRSGDFKRDLDRIEVIQSLAYLLQYSDEGNYEKIKMCLINIAEDGDAFFMPRDIVPKFFAYEQIKSGVMVRNILKTTLAETLAERDSISKKIDKLKGGLNKILLESRSIAKELERQEQELKEVETLESRINDISEDISNLSKNREEDRAIKASDEGGTVNETKTQASLSDFLISLREYSSLDEENERTLGLYSHILDQAPKLGRKMPAFITLKVLGQLFSSIKRKSESGTKLTPSYDGFNKTAAKLTSDIRLLQELLAYLNGPDKLEMALRMGDLSIDLAKNGGLFVSDMIRLFKDSRTGETISLDNIALLSAINLLNDEVKKGYEKNGMKVFGILGKNEGLYSTKILEMMLWYGIKAPGFKGRGMIIDSLKPRLNSPKIISDVISLLSDGIRVKGSDPDVIEDIKGLYLDISKLTLSSISDLDHKVQSNGKSYEPKEEVVNALKALKGFMTDGDTVGYSGVGNIVDTIIKEVSAEDKAMVNPGGIDFNPQRLDLQIKRDGRGMPLPVAEQPAELMNIEGFTPVIINVTPVTNLNLLLGLDASGKKVDNLGKVIPGLTYPKGNNQQRKDSRKLS